MDQYFFKCNLFDCKVCKSKNSMTATSSKLVTYVLIEEPTPKISKHEHCKIIKELPTDQQSLSTKPKQLMFYR